MVNAKLAAVCIRRCSLVAVQVNARLLQKCKSMLIVQYRGFSDYTTGRTILSIFFERTLMKILNAILLALFSASLAHAASLEDDVSRYIERFSGTKTVNEEVVGKSVV